MKITERRLRAIIKSVIKENSSSPAYQHDWMVWAERRGGTGDQVEQFTGICEDVFKDDYRSLALFIMENVPGSLEEIMSKLNKYGYSRQFGDDIY